MDQIIHSIEDKIKELDNNKKILLFLGSGIESFFLSLLLKKHFKNNLFCVLINTIHLDEKEIGEVMYQYYNSGIKNICINARKYFYKYYIMKDGDNLDQDLTNKFNDIFNNYKVYIKEDIDYFSFGFVKNNSFLKEKFFIKNKISFEPLIDKENEDIIILYTKLGEDNGFFIKRKDYWSNLIGN